MLNSTRRQANRIEQAPKTVAAAAWLFWDIAAS